MDRTPLEDLLRDAVRDTGWDDFLRSRIAGPILVKQFHDRLEVDLPHHVGEAAVFAYRPRWPEFADKIKGDGQYLEELGSERREIAAGGKPG